MDNSENRPSNTGVQVRRATVDDLPVIDALQARLGFDVGLHNLGVYFRASVASWQVAISTESGEIVAFHLNIILGLDNLCMGYDMYIRDDFRSRGILHKFGAMYDRKVPTIGNLTPYSLKRVSFGKWDMKMLGFSGMIKGDHQSHFPDTPSGIKVDLVDSEQGLEQVAAYDKTVFRVDREAFNEEWCGNKRFARTLIARDESGQCQGYGTLRAFPGYYGLMPMYANDTSVAKSILARCAAVVGANEKFFMLFDSKNHVMVEAADRWGLECCDTEVRHYNMGGDKIKQYVDESRVYAMHEYWPI